MRIFEQSDGIWCKPVEDVAIKICLLRELGVRREGRTLREAFQSKKPKCRSKFKDDTCHYCKKLVHWRRDCPDLKKWLVLHPVS